MDFKIKRWEIILFLIAILGIFIGLSCVSASEIGGANNIGSDADMLCSVAQTGNIGTFDELNNLKTFETYKDEYVFDKDFAFDENTLNPVINITGDNIVIFGHGHTIDAKGSDLAKFIVSGNNICIFDLNFKNFKTTSDESPIQVNGDKVRLSGCEFYNGIAQNGGALTWNGNEGHMDNAYFLNNTALNRGGALYVTGENFGVCDSTFTTFSSSLSNEAIYYSNENGQILTIDHCHFFNDEITDNTLRVLWNEGCKVIFDGEYINDISFDVVYRDIESLKPGDYYNIEYDYIIKNTDDELTKNRIVNIKADNVTIDGNGHTINLGGVNNFFALFNITGNNVRIVNLNIINSRAYDSDYLRSNKNIYANNYNHLTSPIEWHGDNGVISNCLFYDNVGDFGGAIYWSGNNGTIEKCIFKDNAADFGGSIYICGNNNLIKDCSFNNSYTTNHFEAVYFKNYGNPNLTVNNCSFESENPGAKSIDAEIGCSVIYEGEIPKNNFPPISFEDLCRKLNELKDGDTYNFDRDCFVDSFDEALPIYANNITINGNGYKIYGTSPYTYQLNIYGDNIEIDNLIFDFNFPSDISVPFFTLTGNNAILTNCIFMGNDVKFDGVITWNVNNGLIDNCLFENNSARAIYLDGTNNTISNSIFKNTYSSFNENQIIFYTYKNDGGLLTINNCSFESGNGVKIWIDDNSDVIIDGKSVPKTFDELYEEMINLKDNEVYNIYRNYYSPSKTIVIKNNNITVNANGHTIYVEDNLYESVIIVEGNDFNLNKLDIYASKELRNGSLIDWKGNNGDLLDCTLVGNIAEFGGAVKWTGNNGTIENSEFEDNSAVYAGGAIFIAGEYNTIRNSVFRYTGSQFGGEAIYIDRNRKGVSLENLIFEQSNIFIDGKTINFDLDYLIKNGGESYFCGEYINFYSLIYVSFMNGGKNYYNDSIFYYSGYNNETGDFVFTLSKEFPEYDIFYSKDYIFKNIYNYSIGDVFDAFDCKNYENKFTITKTIYIDSQSSYENAVKNIFKSGLSVTTILKYEDIAKDIASSTLAKENIFTYGLNVIFTKSLSIVCDKTWDLSSSPFDLLNIDGNGSTINASFKKRQEDKWVVLDESDVLTASNLKIQGFNTAVENKGGQCVFNNITFNKNKMDYYIDRDWGAAILNTGFITCVGCKFLSNYAKNGGAIFNQGLLVLQDCEFADNHAYGEGNDVCVGKNGLVIVDGELITKNGQSSVVRIAESMSLGTATFIATFSAAVSFIAGAVVGFFTANPIIGAAVGFAVGAAIGVGGAAIIISNTYDVNYNRLQCVLNLALVSSVSGAMGGAWGAFLGQVYAYVAEGTLFNGKWKLIIEITAGMIIIPSVITGIEYYNTND